jgi:nicotinate-nucleotide--dimethylbenzimidazole phosphoribosyltransferase
MIRMVLKGIRRLETEPVPEKAPAPEDDRVQFDVLACGICRTDAKMWDQGHRDLVFPRVPGHEMVVGDDRGRRFMVWPGNSCGACPYCRAGRENLCEDMKITGFHTDGGFSHRAWLSPGSLIPMSDGLVLYTACFTEPVGCVINAFEKMPLAPGKRLLIFGGGTMGLITAIYARHAGLDPLIMEKDAAKIRKIRPILEELGLTCVKETQDGRFDLVMNACPDPAAFCQAVTKVDKGGHISFFSGITKNETVETNLLNLVHYKEATVSGAYGMKKADMEEAVPFLVSHTRELGLLIEAVVPPEQAPDLLPGVLSGKHLKYILDFRG